MRRKSRMARRREVTERGEELRHADEEIADNTTDNRIVVIIPMDKGAAAKFPFKLKDDFRKKFPSAKWNRTEKRWEVGPRTIKRLEQWAAEVEQAADALKRIEQMELTEREINETREVVAKLECDLREQEKKSGTLETYIEELNATCELLATRGAQLKAVSKGVAALEEHAKARRAEIYERLAIVIDFGAIDEAKQNMRRYHSDVGATAKRMFHEAQEVIKRERTRLAEAGLHSAELDYLANANFNRPDRDGVNLMPAGARYEVWHIESTASA